MVDFHVDDNCDKEQGAQLSHERQVGTGNITIVVRETIAATVVTDAIGGHSFGVGNA